MSVHILVDDICCGTPRKFRTNSWINGMDIRNATHLHRMLTKLSRFQQVVSYAGIKIFNSLPSMILNLRNDK